MQQAWTKAIVRSAFLVTSAAAFTVAPLATTSLEPELASLVHITLGVLIALAASGTINALAIGGGAVGMLASGLLMDVAPAAAGGALFLLCFAERSLRVPTVGMRLLHLGTALLSGAGAGALCARFADAGPGARFVAVVMSAVLVGLPLLINAVDPIAHALDGLANQLVSQREPLVAEQLHNGAQLRRAAMADESVVDPAREREQQAAWRALLRLAQSRAKLTSPTNDAAPIAKVIRRLDQRIADHVSALGKAAAAAGAVDAAAASLDVHPLQSVESTSLSLERMGEAMVDDLSKL